METSKHGLKSRYLRRKPSINCGKVCCGIETLYNYAWCVMNNLKKLYPQVFFYLDLKGTCSLDLMDA